MPLRFAVAHRRKPPRLTAVNWQILQGPLFHVGGYYISFLGLVAFVAFYQGGLKIYTTLDNDYNDKMQQVLQDSKPTIATQGATNAAQIAVNPKTGELWCSVNERDGLGDNLVPDYITHVEEGGYYGWPWWYMGGHQDPRHAGKHPELKGKLITPDVMLQPHNASLGITFYEGKQFPPEYQGDIFAAEHGSWNKSTRVGYEVIRVPLHQTGHATGEYEDFLTGFVVDNEHVWGRPVGVAVAPDGSLLVTDDASDSIWRISYAGH